MKAASVSLMLAVLLLPQQLAAQNERALLDAGVATTEQLNAANQASIARIEQMEAEFERRLKDLDYQIELLTNRVGDMERAQELEERQNARESLNKRRSLNWPKVSTGMTRRQILRLIGSGVRDKSATTKDCRCYSQGRICFDANDLAKKSNVRCQL